MKKFLLAILLLFILFWIGVMVFIPSLLTVSSVVYTQGQAAKVNTVAMTTDGWKKWWPGNDSSATYQHGIYTYSIATQTPVSTTILAKAGNDTFTSELLVLPVTPDSSAIQWKTELATSMNPLTRIQQYNRAASIKSDFQLLLDSLSAYLNDRKKIYGLDIQITNFKNPFMITTQVEFAGYPSINEVYKSIGKLRDFAKAGGAVLVDSPMINITQADKNYLLRTALPVSKKLDASNDIGFKQMVLGKTLLAVTQGGRHSVEQSLSNMQTFIADYRLSSPAIPFQILETNRQQQVDSSKWITRLYFPIY